MIIVFLKLCFFIFFAENVAAINMKMDKFLATKLRSTDDKEYYLYPYSNFNLSMRVNYKQLPGTKNFGCFLNFRAQYSMDTLRRIHNYKDHSGDSTLIDIDLVYTMAPHNTADHMITIVVGKYPPLITNIIGGTIEHAVATDTPNITIPNGFQEATGIFSCIDGSNRVYTIACQYGNDVTFMFAHNGGNQSAYIKIERVVGTFPVKYTIFPELLINNCRVRIDGENIIVINGRLHEAPNNIISLENGFIHVHGNRNGYYPDDCAAESIPNVLTVTQFKQVIEIRYKVVGGVLIEPIIKATNASTTVPLPQSTSLTPVTQTTTESLSFVKPTTGNIRDAVASATAFPKWGIVLIIIGALFLISALCAVMYFCVGSKLKSKPEGKPQGPLILPKSNFDPSEGILSKPIPMPSNNVPAKPNRRKSAPSSLIQTPEMPATKPVSTNVDKDVTPKGSDWFYRNAYYAPVGRKAHISNDKPFVVKFDKFWDIFPFRGGIPLPKNLEGEQPTEYLCQFRDLTLDENRAYCNFVKRFHEPFAGPEDSQQLFKAYILQHDPPSFELHFNGVGAHFLSTLSDCKRCFNYNTGVSFVPIFKSSQLLTVVEQLKLLPRGWHFFASLATTDEITDDSGRLITVYLFRSRSKVALTPVPAEEQKGCYHTHKVRLFGANKQVIQEHRKKLKEHAVEMTADGKVASDFKKLKPSVHTDHTQADTKHFTEGGVIKTIELDPTQTVTKETQEVTFAQPSLEPSMG